MPFKFITCRSYLHRHNAHVVLVGEEEKENQKKPKKTKKNQKKNKQTNKEENHITTFGTRWSEQDG